MSYKEVLAAQGDRDYARADSKYVLPQRWDEYTQREHSRWRALYVRQIAQLQKNAHPCFLDALLRLDCENFIPNFDQANDCLRQASDWRIVGVPGVIPDDAFFWHLSNSQFPVTTALRGEDEEDFCLGIDLFHDFFGHVPMLFNETFARFMQRYGALARDTTDDHERGCLANLYLNTVEFGLIEHAGALRIFGAGILSSRTETVYALESNRPQRIPFSVEVAMRTEHDYSSLQSTYFVVRSFTELYEAMEADLRRVYATLRSLRFLPKDKDQASNDRSA